MHDSDDSIDPLIKRLRALAQTNDYIKHGGRKRLAEELGLSYPHLFRLLTKEHKPQRTTLDRIAAFLEGKPASPIPVRAAPSASLPNLSICIAYHGDRWPPYALAAAKAGAFSTDTPANAWPARLDALTRAIEACATEKT